MIYQELIIDGVSVDIPENTDITLEINSNIFNDITEITTNRSYTISLPKTVRNLTLLDNCDKVGMDSDVPYMFHTCEYRRNGVPIIRNGRATITECEDDISVNIYWGLFPFLEKLIEENKNLNELSSDLHILFNKDNELSDYETFKSEGYGYADYYPCKYSDIDDDWSNGSLIQTDSKTVNYFLIDGKIYTGTEIGGTSSGNRVEDPDYVCLSTDFTVGMKAQINNVVGIGNYRSYAILDKVGNVIEIAPETPQTETSNGDVEATNRASFDSGNYLFPRNRKALHVDKIEILIEGNGHSNTIEYGLIDATTYEIQILGNVEIAAVQTDSVKTINVDTDKPDGKYIYIRQTDSENPVLMIFAVDEGTSDLSSYNIDTGTYSEASNYNLCVKVYYTTDSYVPTSYSVTAPALAAKLVVNNNTVYSANPSVAITTREYDSIISSELKVDAALQPVVTCWWVLRQIMSDYGLSISWDSASEDYIKQLVLPLVTRYADAATLAGGLEADMVEMYQKLGTITLDVKNLPTSFEQVSGEVTSLKVVTDCSLQFDIQAYCEFELPDEPSGTRISQFGDKTVKIDYWMTSEDYIKMTVTHSAASGDEPDEYIIGSRSPDSPVGLLIYDYVLNGNVYTSLFYGFGQIDLVAGDTVKFELLNDYGTHKALRLYDGFIKSQLVDSDNVPYGGMFPVVKNLGDISITDYIKTLNLLTGTFPLQRFDNDTVTMATYNELWENKSKALDWTNKLIAKGTRNKPRNVTYNIEGYYQHNYFKWKEDEDTKGSYDYDMKIDNPTLEDENDTFEFPFAASDGDRVPLYADCKEYPANFTGPRAASQTKYSITRASASTDGTTSSGGTYSACEPRIMNLTKNEEGKAALNFSINLDTIFSQKYGNLIKAITKACVIREYLYLSDIEIMNFDERIPVYFAQYGAFFAVLSIKVSSDGYSEVEMIKL